MNPLAGLIYLLMMFGIIKIIKVMFKNIV
jgi:hypothetical protein